MRYFRERLQGGKTGICPLGNWDWKPKSFRKSEISIL